MSKLDDVSQFEFLRPALDSVDLVSLGARVYTIMPFAKGGVAPLIVSDVNEDIVYGRVNGSAGPMSARLSGLSGGDYFLDTRSLAGDSLFATRQPVTVEAGSMRLALAKGFDAIVWIARVHPAHFIGIGPSQ